jgi:hypothetical protein
MRTKVKGVFVTPQGTAGRIWLAFPHNDTEYGGPTGPHRGSSLHPKELLGGFGSHFFIMSLSMVVLLDHIARSHHRQAVAAAAIAALPPSLLPCCRHRQASATTTTAVLLPPPPPRFCLRRRRAAAKLPPLPPLPLFLSSLLLLSSLQFLLQLPLTLLVDC